MRCVQISALTFDSPDRFLEWRVALMELALQDLSLATATKAITADYDPYKIYQVHDYKDISFLRQSAPVKSASSETIRVFAQNYPELLKEKFLYVPKTPVVIHGRCPVSVQAAPMGIPLLSTLSVD